MKISIKAQALIILFLISFSSVTINCRKSKLSRNLISRVQKSQGNKEDESSGILNFIKTNILDADTIMYFILGILSEIFPAVGELYTHFKENSEDLKKCVNPAVEKYKSIKLEEKSKADEAIKKNSEVVGIMSKLKDEASKKAYCKQVKEETNEIFERAEVTKRDRDFDIAGLFKIFFNTTVGKVFANANEFCSRIFSVKSKFQSEIIYKYNSLEEYVNQCVFFYNLDCNTLANPSSLGEFLSKAYKYYDITTSTAECLIELLKKFESNKFIKIFQQIAEFGANFLSGGLYGAGKATYHFFALLFEIYEVKKNWETIKDRPYRVGGIVGKAIKIVLSLIKGRRRKLRIMSKKLK